MSEDFPCGARLLIPGPAGVLEAQAGCPPENQARPVTAVVCHPHPLHGGTMQNKVVHTLARSFERLGARSLRFNFRGVGASAGSFADGAGETEDALAVLTWARARRSADAIWLAGFSFGAYVALRAAARFAVAQLVTVAPAVHLHDFTQLTIPATPWLLIQGLADEVVAPALVRGWVQHVRPAPRLVELPDVGHFFHGRLHTLQETVMAQLGARVPPR
jgi:hypothetical protein